MPVQCCYTPQGRSFEEYLKYLQGEAERFTVDENKIESNFCVAQKMSENASSKAAEMPDEAYVHAMKGAHFLQGMLNMEDNQLRRYSLKHKSLEGKKAVRSVLKDCIAIAESIVPQEGGPLRKLYRMAFAEEESQQAMRSSLLEKQYMKGELGEDDRGHLTSKDDDKPNLLEIQKNEEADRLRHEAQRQEVFEKRSAEAVVQNNMFAAVLGSSKSSPVGVVSPTEQKDEKYLRLQAKLNGVQYVPPALVQQLLPPVAPPAPVEPAASEIVAPARVTPIAQCPTLAPTVIAPKVSPSLPSPAVVAVSRPATDGFLTFRNKQSESTYAASYSAPAWSYPSAGKPSRIGLRNLGNTCFMNSVLQCLYSVTSFRSDIEGEKYLEDLQFGGNKGRVVNSLAEVFRNMSERSGLGGVPIDPSNLKRTIGERNESFSGFSQQDASELFLSLINEVHTDINSKTWFLPPSKTPLAVEQQQNDYALSIDSARQYFRLNSLKSIVPRTFMLQTRSLTVCGKCGNSSKVINTEMGLELPFPDTPLKQNEIIDIETLLRQYCKKERFVATGPNDSQGYKCSRCNHYVNADRQTTLFSLPKILTLTLKRFKSYGNFADKISCCVSFPKELSVAPFCATESNLLSTEFIINLLRKEQFDSGSDVPKSSAGKYRLVGIVNHRGNIHGGHYTADVFDKPRNSWASISDEVCKAADKPDRALAYMLFYELS